MCAQAGNVNTGAFDPLGEIAAAAREHGAWVHVDGAFGLWAAASPALRISPRARDAADSWATDGHKWLNVPYDCGVVAVARPRAHAAAMGMHRRLPRAPGDADRTNSDWSPGGVAAGDAVSRSTRRCGRWADGVAELVERCCSLARRWLRGCRRRRGAQ